MKHSIPFRKTPLVLAIAASLASPLWVQAAPGDPLGPEFRVNTYTTSFQASPTVAMDTDGNFVVAWMSHDQDGSVGGIYAQRYDHAGVPQGAEFRVNTYTASQQGFPTVAIDADGDFVVTWWSHDQDSSGWGIYAQRYDRVGVAQGPEFQVNTFTTNTQWASTVAMDADGDFVVAWESDGQDGDGKGIYAQRYNRAGVPQGVEFRVNTYTTNNQSGPTVAMDADGDFVVAWESGDDSFYGIYAQRYNRAGVPQGPEFRVNTYTTDSQFGPAVAVDADGDFVVAWMSDGQDGDGKGIYAQRYNRAGVSQGAEFRVNTFTTNHQWIPAVAMDTDGAFVVAWMGNGQDSSGYGSYAQRYNSAGVPQGAEFRVNTYTRSHQRWPAVAMDADGAFVVTWESSGQDSSNTGIYAQRYAGASGGNTVIIDIKPGTSPNRINPGRNDRLPVAILGSSTFDTTQVDPATVRFGPDQARDIPDRRQFTDVDSDGNLDLVLRFQTLDTGMQCGDTQASLTGVTFAGEAFQGTDRLRTIRCQAVTIDIKPGITPNRLNPNRPDRLPVAILTTPSFDATQVGPRRVRLGPDRARDLPERRRIIDVDGDGDLDLVLRFRVLDTGLHCGDTQATLTGVTFTGQAFIGSDTVRTVGCR